MSRIDNIKRFAAMRDDKIQSEIIATEEKIENYKDEIRKLKPRIDELLAVGNACIDNGIEITSSKCGSHQGYDNHYFISNSWSHLTGFITEGKNKPLRLVGKIGGGACDWNLSTDGNEIIVTGNVERVLQMFLNQFDLFEREFYNYVDSVTEIKE